MLYFCQFFTPFPHGVPADWEELVVSHNAYGVKANIELTEPAMRGYVNQKLDDADDLISKASAKIDRIKSLEESVSEKREVDLCVDMLRALYESRSSNRSNRST